MEPRGYEINFTIFRIDMASMVRIETRYNSGDMRFVEYVVSGNSISGTTNYDHFNPFVNVNIHHPALEIWDGEEWARLSQEMFRRYRASRNA
jgi:hypothetical protein